MGSRDALDISGIRKSPVSTGIRTPDLADRSLVTIQSMLYRFKRPCSHQAGIQGKKP